MSEAEQVSAAQVGGGGSSGRRGIWAVVALAVMVVLALGVATAIWYRMPNSANSNRDSGQAAAATTSTPSGGSDKTAEKALARRIFLEQWQSHNAVDHLTAGEIKRIDIVGRKIGLVEATTTIMATFVDGSKAPGSIGTVRWGKSWYFVSMIGLKRPGTSGMAGAIDPNNGYDFFTDIPDSDIDWPLSNEMVAQQKIHQEFIGTLVNGPVTTIHMSKPTKGARTVSIDATAVSKGGAPDQKIRIVIVPAQFQGSWYHFIASMRKL